MSLKEMLRKANGEQAYQELAEIRRNRIAQGAGPVALLEASASSERVVNPDDSLTIHHAKYDNVPPELIAQVPAQRTSQESAKSGQTI